MALKATADDNQERYSPDVTEVVRRNFYVDDVLKSTTRIDEAIRISTELSSLLKEGGFRLTKFTTCHPSYCRSSSSYKICGERSFPGMNRSLNLTDRYGIESFSYEWEVVT
ncbi:hypothetical protein QZH41_017749, partial [Actinostola sp. cb2023]